jgi:hypothetical protein
MKLYEISKGADPFAEKRPDLDTLRQLVTQAKDHQDDLTDTYGNFRRRFYVDHPGFLVDSSWYEKPANKGIQPIQVVIYIVSDVYGRLERSKVTLMIDPMYKHLVDRFVKQCEKYVLQLLDLNAHALGIQQKLRNYIDKMSSGSKQNDDWK